MAIGAQGYSIAGAIRTLLGEVLDVMYFKKWLAIDFKWRVDVAAFANALGLFKHPGADPRVANEGSAHGGDLLRLHNAIRHCMKGLLL